MNQDALIGSKLSPKPPSVAGAPRIGVVIPCYRVSRHVVGVIEAIGPEVTAVYVVDDCCPERSGDIVQDRAADPRVRVLRHAVNKGVGGATMTGMRAAIADGMDIIVKIDGDGQMDPALLPRFVESIHAGNCDYAKGNRFFDLKGLEQMPWLRLAGNAGLSFLAKASTGYWHCFDPTNGYFAIHRKVAEVLPFHKIDERYFFETDLLFRLNIVGAMVMDIPMSAVYGDESSSLRPTRVIKQFLFGHIRNFFKRIFYNYFLRNFSIASIELVLSMVLVCFGAIFGIMNWSAHGQPATAGTVMVSALPIILGLQLGIAFLNFDIEATPKTPLHKRL